MTKIIEKDGYTFKVKVDADIYNIQYVIKTKKKFLWFYIWVTIDSYDSCLFVPLKISHDSKTIIQSIQEKIDQYIATKNNFAEISNYLENWSKE